MKKVIVVMTGLFLLMAVAGLAKAPSTKMMETRGKILSISDNTLVIQHKVKKTEVDTTFVLNSDTKKEGKLETNGMATVHYRIEGRQNVATLVKEEHGM